jgi:hypothetical protein
MRSILCFTLIFLVLCSYHFTLGRRKCHRHRRRCRRGSKCRDHHHHRCHSSTWLGSSLLDPNSMSSEWQEVGSSSLGRNYHNSFVGRKIKGDPLRRNNNYRDRLLARRDSLLGSLGDLQSSAEPSITVLPPQRRAPRDSHFIRPPIVSSLASRIKSKQSTAPKREEPILLQPNSQYGFTFSPSFEDMITETILTKKIRQQRARDQKGRRRTKLLPPNSETRPVGVM